MEIVAIHMNCVPNCAPNAGPTSHSPPPIEVASRMTPGPIVRRRFRRLYDNGSGRSCCSHTALAGLEVNTSGVCPELEWPKVKSRHDSYGVAPGVGPRFPETPPSPDRLSTPLGARYKICYSYNKYCTECRTRRLARSPARDLRARRDLTGDGPTP